MRNGAASGFEGVLNEETASLARSNASCALQLQDTVGIRSARVMARAVGILRKKKQIAVSPAQKRTIAGGLARCKVWCALHLALLGEIRGERYFDFSDSPHFHGHFHCVGAFVESAGAHSTEGFELIPLLLTSFRWTLKSFWCICCCKWGRVSSFGSHVGCSPGAKNLYLPLPHTPRPCPVVIVGDLICPHLLGHPLVRYLAPCSSRCNHALPFPLSPLSSWSTAHCLFFVENSLKLLKMRCDGWTVQWPTGRIENESQKKKLQIKNLALDRAL